MAVLSDADRVTLWAAYQRDLSRLSEGLNLSKAELRAAVDAADAWADANAGSYNSALPLPARNVLSAAQKARLLRGIIQRRFEVS